MLRNICFLHMTSIFPFSSTVLKLTRCSETKLNLLTAAYSTICSCPQQHMHGFVITTYLPTLYSFSIVQRFITCKCYLRYYVTFHRYDPFTLVSIFSASLQHLFSLIFLLKNSPISWWTRYDVIIYIRYRPWHIRIVFWFWPIWTSQFWNIIFLFPFHSPILKPDFDLPFCQSQHMSYLYPPSSCEISVIMKLLFKFQGLVSCVGLSGPFLFICNFSWKWREKIFMDKI